MTHRGHPREITGVKPFMTEADMRGWMRLTFGSRVFWLEPSAGSTFGFPDAMIVLPSEAKRASYTVLVEAKLATEAKGVLRFRVRTPQVICLSRLVDLGVPVIGLVGVRGTGDLYWVPVGEEFLAGALGTGGKNGSRGLLFKVARGTSCDYQMARLSEALTSRVRIRS